MLAYEIFSVCFIVFCLWLARQARIACERVRAENERSETKEEYLAATAAQGIGTSVSFNWRVSKDNE